MYLNSYKFLSDPKLLVLALVCVLPWLAGSAHGLEIVRVIGADQAAREQLDESMDLWHVEQDGTAIVAVVDDAQRRQLVEAGFEFIVDQPLTDQYRSLQGRSLRSIPGFDCYRTVEETLTTLNQLVATYPALAERIDIGDSWEKETFIDSGYDLVVIKITNQAISGSKPALVASSAIHARELATAELNTRFAERLLDGYDTDPNLTWLIDHHEIHLLLQTNPDGRKQAEAGNLWRKNTNQNYCGSTSSNRGVDLNRNFPFQWGGAGASTNQCAETYRGPTPASEPEATALIDYLRAVFPDQREPPLDALAPLNSQGVFIDLHSFGRLVLWPWGMRALNAPNQAQLSTLGRKFTFFNDHLPQRSSSLGSAAGATDDFAYGDLGVAAYTFELGTSFFQTCSVFESSIVEQNIAALIYAAKSAQAPYQLPSGPDVVELEAIPNSVLAGQEFTIVARADGARFGAQVDATSPQELPRQIKAISAFVGTSPWSPPPTVDALSATDGAFDSSAESASTVLSSSALALGRQKVFAQAVGLDDQAGVPMAAFVQVLDIATSGRIFGRVVSDAGVGLQAQIMADQFSTVSDPDGSFELFLVPDTYLVTISAEGFRVFEQTLTLVAGGQRQLEPVLLGRCNLLADDMEQVSDNWTANGSWARSTERAQSGQYAFTDSPGTDYSNNRSTSLTSKVLDLSDAQQLELSFGHWCQTEAGQDFGFVQAFDGSRWSEIFRCTDQPSWQQETIGLSALDGVVDARIRFRLVTSSVDVDDGWYIDDVEISGFSEACRNIEPLPDEMFADGFE